MKRIAVFGATGSVGTQALDVIRAHPDELEICCLGAGSDAASLTELVEEFAPGITALADANAAGRYTGPGQLLSGEDAMERALAECAPDVAVVAVSGIAGLPLLAACLERGITTALANKEAIVAGGDVMTRLRRDSQSRLVPLDSEHAAIYQCLGDSFLADDVRNLWLTASGGPFREWPKDRIDRAAPQDALDHPTWNMGRKITIDSASLANKGLEVIEAHYLFDVPYEQIKVVVQPESIIHSMVEFKDTSVLAQLAPADMRLPVRRALLGPGAEDNAGKAPLDFETLGTLAFMAPDTERFPSLALAYAAGQEGQGAVFNAADEVAVHAFLDGRLAFGAIPRLIEDAIGHFMSRRAESIPAILELDAEVRSFAASRIAVYAGKGF